MCGIFGIWRMNGFHVDDLFHLKRMSKMLIHRGPDDVGYLCLNTRSGKFHLGPHLAEEPHQSNLFLGCRRLAILDTSHSGRQPMTNPEKDIFIVHNGEIFNHADLREELLNKGYHFQSTTDTEVILKAYEEWGFEFVKKLEGMWAFLIWDQRRQQLFYCRDRFGIKPLYYMEEDGATYFASEVKALKAVRQTPTNLNYAGIAQFLVTPNFDFANYGIYQEIKSVPKTYWFCMTATKEIAEKYWEYTDQSRNYDYANPERQLLELLEKATIDYTHADRKVGLLLSGGLDSSTLAILDSRQDSPKIQDAFVATFPEKESINEYQYARLMADWCKMNLHTVTYQPENIPEDIKTLIHHLDAPPGKGQELVRFQLLKKVSQYVPVVLEGQGADEGLGGYLGSCLKAYSKDELQSAGLFEYPAAIRRIFSAIQSSRNLSTWGALSQIVREKMKRHSRVVDLASPNDQILSPDLQDLVRTKTRIEPVPQFSYELTKRCYHQHSSLVLPNLLHYGDWISMAHSVESRMPFMNHYIVEFLFGLPFDQLIQGKYSKRILRKAMNDLLPGIIVNRTNKIGFTIPYHLWLYPHLNSLIKPVLLTNPIRQRGLFNLSKLRQMVVNFEKGDTQNTSLLFRCVSLEMWFEQMDIPVQEGLSN